MIPKDRMQVAAFHAIYNRFRKADKPRLKEMDLAEAIVLTSDDAMANTDPALAQQWLALYDGKSRRGKGTNTQPVDAGPE